MQDERMNLIYEKHAEWDKLRSVIDSISEIVYDEEYVAVLDHTIEEKENENLKINYDLVRENLIILENKLFENTRELITLVEDLEV